MNLDDLMIQLWNPGRYQLLIYILLSFNYYQVSMNNLCMVFYIAPPIHYCHVTPNSSKWIRPNSSDADCFVYSRNESDNQELRQKSACPEGWDYEFHGREWNLVSEWDLVCDKTFLAGLIPTIYFVGSMVGGIIFGYLSDVFGRKKIMLPTLYTTIGIGIGLHFVQHSMLLIILRFLQGATVQGMQGVTTVLIMEMLPPKIRSSAGIVVGVSLAFGCLILGTGSYIFQHWRLIQLLISVPGVLTITYIWIIPESLRWLITNQRFPEAESVLQKFLKFNKIQLSNDIVGHLEDIELSRSNDEYSALDLLRTPVIRKYSLINFYVWLANSWVYYGLSLSIPTLSGDKYFNFLIGSLVELPSYVMAFFVLKKFGRRKPLICYYTFCGLACIAAGTIPDKSASGADISWLKTSFALIGRATINGCLSIMFLYTTELFPTVLRNVAVGACLFWEPLGGAMAPQMVVLGQYTYTFVPIVIFGLMSLIGACLFVPLPETLHKQMPDTIEEAENLGKNKSHAETLVSPGNNLKKSQSEEDYTDEIISPNKQTTIESTEL